MAYYQVPRNLPHAATIVRRIEFRLGAEIHEHPDAEDLVSCVQDLHDLLGQYEGEEEPIETEAQQVAEAGVVAARKLVDEIERLSVGEDRLGQSIRNLFGI